MNKWVLGGIGFLIVLSVGCVLWYQHDIAPYRREAAETEAFARQWEKDRQAQQKRSAETQETSTDTPAESDTPQNAEKPITDTTQANETTNTDNSVIAGTTEPVRMSPHGGGAYPEIPEQKGSKYVYQTL